MATHYSTLAWKNPIDGGAWQATVHGVAKSLTLLSDFTQSLIMPYIHHYSIRLSSLPPKSSVFPPDSFSLPYSQPLESEHVSRSTVADSAIPWTVARLLCQ